MAARCNPDLLAAFRDENPLAGETDWHLREDVIHVHQVLARETLADVMVYR